MKIGVSKWLCAWSVMSGIFVLVASSANAQHAAPMAVTARPAAVAQVRTGVFSAAGQSSTENSTAKGVGIGLLVGALAGAVVGAVIESGNEGGIPEIRERYRGYAYAVFIPTGAVVGAVMGGIIGARRR
jgi:hypothetical protein